MLRVRVASALLPIGVLLYDTLALIGAYVRHVREVSGSTDLLGATQLRATRTADNSNDSLQIQTAHSVQQ